MADVAGPRTWHLGFEVIGLSVEGPIGRRCATAPKVRTSYDITFLITDDAHVCCPL
jgi:hypothetical protein